MMGIATSWAIEVPFFGLPRVPRIEKFNTHIANKKNATLADRVEIATWRDRIMGSRFKNFFPLRNTSNKNDNGDSDNSSNKVLKEKPFKFLIPWSDQSTSTTISKSNSSKSSSSSSSSSKSCGGGSDSGSSGKRRSDEDCDHILDFGLLRIR